jgi:23S rRNA pseudouridine1911/1915/1917 synthase
MAKKQSKYSSKNRKNRQSTITVSESSELLPFLIATLKDKTRTKIKGMLTHKQFKVNKDIVTKHNHQLSPGDQVIVNWDTAHRKQVYEGVKIVFEDDDIIVINKRSGLLSIGSAKEKRQTAYRIVTRHIQQENPVAKLFVVHRLDREASGLMVFAKNRNAQLELKESWEQTFNKNMYLAIAEGTMEKDEDTIKSYLRESKALIVHSSNNPKDGKEGVTRYKVVKKNEYFTLLEAWLDTERKNQLRVHLQSIKHPILGDKKYGSTQNPINRAGFHLRTIHLIHPKTQEKLTFETKVPEDFLKLFRFRYYE